MGGGQTSAAQGIHWHVASTIYYLPLDDARQDIGWVSVESPEGRVEYMNPDEAAKVTEASIQSNKRLMDCVDCHNRATHQFNSPEGPIG